MLEESQVVAVKLVEMFQAAFMDVVNVQESRFSVKGVSLPVKNVFLNRV
jgi:hypothetical protein